MTVFAQTGNVGQWLGFTFVEANGLTGTALKYYDSTGALKTVDVSKVNYIMYYHEALSIISNFEVARIVDSGEFRRLQGTGRDEHRLQGDKQCAGLCPQNDSRRRWLIWKGGNQPC